MKLEPNYSALAHYYHLLEEDLPLFDWAVYLETLIGEHTETSPKILDLACGTGTIAKMLSDKLNTFVIGLDLSRDMLMHASSECICADMNFIPFQENSIRVAYSTHCAVNYLNSLGLHLAEVHRILERGGIYIFDCSSRARAEAWVNSGGYFIQKKAKKLSLKATWTSFEKIIVDVHAETENTAGDIYEQHHQTIFSENEILTLIHENGFRLLGRDLNYRSKRMNESDPIYNFVLQKP